MTNEQDAARAGEIVRASFAKQGLMDTLGAEVVSVAPGEVEIATDFRPGLSQQHGSSTPA